MRIDLDQDFFKKVAIILLAEKRCLSAAPMRLIAIALFCIICSTASAQHKAQYLSYRPVGSPAGHEKPVHSLTTIGVARCEALYNSGSFSINQFEDAAVRKEESSGKEALDEHDAKWLMSAENRKAACMQLLKESGKLTWRDRLLLWWWHRD